MEADSHYENLTHIHN